MMNISFSNRAFFPHDPTLFSHSLSSSDLLKLDNFVEVASLLPIEMIETNDSDEGIEIKDKIANIQSLSSWIMFRNLEQITDYKLFMYKNLQLLVDSKIIKSNDILNPMCFVFLSSPNVITPFHIDPEHNFLFQVIGTKDVFVNNESLNPIVSPKEISDFYKDELNFRFPILKDEYIPNMNRFTLTPDKGVYIPVTYPHLVNNGNHYSISFSLTFRTEFSEKCRIKNLNL